MCLNNVWFSFGRDFIPNIVKNHITKFIMDKIHIKVRPSHEKDDPIEFHIMNKFRPFIRFHPTTAVLRNTNDTAMRIYTNPSIEINDIDYRIMIKITDTSYIGYISTYSSIIHEVTHYLQATYIGPDYTLPIDSASRQKYIRIPGEFEAFSVQSYYLLNYIDPKRLKKIIKRKVSDKRRMELLINAYTRILYPWRKTDYPK